MSWPLEKIPLCRNNFNFYLKMNSMWAEPEAFQLIWRWTETCSHGEAIDWDDVEAKHTPNTACHGPCLRQVCLKHEFSAREWKNKVDPYCKICVKRMKEEGNSHRCTICRRWRSEDVFAKWMLNKGFLAEMVCNSCTTSQRVCSI